jgi:4-hydroxy-3-methylbut-2-enyl diphosphate reductase
MPDGPAGGVLAHGVPKAVPAEAKARKMLFLDATCPLVSKVHVEAQRHFDAGREIVLIGHAGHPEVVGHHGPAARRAVALIETVADAQAFTPRDPANVAFVTQTTLSVDDTADIVARCGPLPGIAAPHKEDICYATTNRQEAVKASAGARGAAGAGQRQFVELGAAGRGGRARRGAGLSDRRRRRAGLRLAGRRAHAWA